ncbi:hypothetical protein JXA88_14730 [Candidatus Fermentibacteria bacterium]|nr:hypothetical protein [Candidatus Fermentibacteria bacterium]
MLARFLERECTEKPGALHIEADAQLMQLLPERLMRTYRMVPLGRSPSGVLKLAVSEPLSIGGIDQVKRRLGMPVRLILVDSDTIETLLGVPVQSVAVQPPLPPEPTSASVSLAPSRPIHTPSTSAASAEGSLAQDQGAVLRPRMVRQRVDAPEDWQPDPVPGELPSVLEEAFNALQSVVESSQHVFLVVTGPDSARDLVLRKLRTVTWGDHEAFYLDLIAHHFPAEVDHQRRVPTILDGVDVAGIDEEEERRLLRTISAAYAAKTPLVLGMRKSPKESQNLSGGLRLTLGLAKMVPIEVEETAERSASPPDFEQLFLALADETAAWSEAAFAGASLRPLLQAASRAYTRGSRQEALGKAATAVASRVSHLTEERLG